MSSLKFAAQADCLTARQLGRLWSLRKVIVLDRHEGQFLLAKSYVAVHGSSYLGARRRA